MIQKKKDRMLRVVVSEDIEAAARQFADRECSSVSQVIRRALVRDLTLSGLLPRAS
jgi:hypothetical protein